MKESAGKIVLIPCGAREPIGHVYKIVLEPDTKLWMTLDNAKNTFGKDNITESASSTICPDCSASMKNNL